MSAVAVHRVVTGRADAPVVVLSNSLGSTMAMWDANLADLEEHFHVVRYDTRGHGGSPVPEGPYDIDDLVDDVVALLDDLGVARAHVVGLSLGGMTGMRLAASPTGSTGSSHCAPAPTFHRPRPGTTGPRPCAAPAPVRSPRP
jgi:3-oxoadipate enol-lactonase